MSWLAFSIIASVVLTVALNVALRLFPGAGRRLHDRAAAEASRSGGRVVVPWKTMLIASLVLTIAINVLIRVL
jgi:hypothetical protein